MTRQLIRHLLGHSTLVCAATILSLVTLVERASAHHSFAMYDQDIDTTLTGKLTRFVPGSNHAQLLFELVDADGTLILENGEPILWGVETTSAARLARSDVTVDSFPLGTIITVTLNPLRDGRNFGAMTNTTGSLVGCGMSMPSGGCTKDTGRVYIDVN